MASRCTPTFHRGERVPLLPPASASHVRADFAFSLDFLGKKSHPWNEGEAEVFGMADFARALGASKSASTLLVLFIPSRDRTDQSIDQAYWVNLALTVLGTLFGGGYSFSPGQRGMARRCPQRQATL